MASDFLVSLGLANLAASVAILGVLALRGSARRFFGAGVAYAFWLIVPGAMLATLLPARTVPVQIPSEQAETAPVVLGHAANVAVDPAFARAVAAAPEAFLNGPQMLLTVWLAGVAVSLFLLVIAQRRALARFGRVTDDVQDSRIARASTGSAGPALVGVVRPRLVLPHNFEERFDANERAMILTHERTHLASGHTAINALMALFKAFNWFNPLIHLGARYARMDQELACDAAVMARYPHERQAYAHALLKTQLASATLPLGCSWPARTPGLLEERLIMLTRDRPGRLRLIAGAFAVTFLFVGSGLAACAAKPPVVKVEQVPPSAQVRIATPAPAPAGPVAAAPTVKPAESAVRSSDRFSTGDAVRVVVSNEPSLSGDFVVDERGVIQMALIGEVTAKNQTARDVQTSIERRLRDGGFLEQPKVSVEKAKGGHYYIFGEVNRAGEFPLTPGLTMINAIAIAGDFTYRADKTKVMITSANSGEEREVTLTPATPISPGDRIRIGERFSDQISPGTRAEEVAVRQNAAAAAMLMDAANRGLVMAEYRLAKLYEKGEGVPRDMAQSRAWTEKAAIGGNVKAMHDLAVFFAEGDAGPQSFAAAAEWFHQASDHGLVYSQYNLAMLYEQGLGLTQDKNEAAYWFEIAGRAGDQDAARRGRALFSDMPTAQAENLKRRARAFSPKPDIARANGELE